MLYSLSDVQRLTGVAKQTLLDWLQRGIFRAAVPSPSRGPAGGHKLDAIGVVCVAMLAVVQRRLGGQLPFAAVRPVVAFLQDTLTESELRSEVAEGRAVLVFSIGRDDPPRLLSPDAVVLGRGELLMAVNLGGVLATLDRATEALADAKLRLAVAAN